MYLQRMCCSDVPKTFTVEILKFSDEDIMITGMNMASECPIGSFFLNASSKYAKEFNETPISKTVAGFV